MQLAQTFVNKPTDYRRYLLTKLGSPPTSTLSHWGQASFHKQSECGRHGLPNVLTLQQRSCIQFITNEQVKLTLYMSGVDFTLGIRYVPLNIKAYQLVVNLPGPPYNLQIQ